MAHGGRATDEHRHSGLAHQLRQRALKQPWRRIHRGGDDHCVAAGAALRDSDVLERGVRAEHESAQVSGLGLEGKQQQPDLVLLPGRAGGYYARPGGIAHAVLKARPQLAAEVRGKEMLLGDGSREPPPAIAQVEE